MFARKKRARPPIEPIFDGERQAQLIALACSEPPEGHARWSIHPLAEKAGPEQERNCKTSKNWKEQSEKKTGA